MPLTRAINIGDESRILSKLFDDLDNYRRFYTMPEKDTEDNKTISIQFAAPKLFLFEEFRFSLLANSTIKQLDPEMYYRPDYVSYNEYGTTNLWGMLLFINDIPTIEDFSVETIKVPSKFIVLELTNTASERKLLKEIVPLYELDPKPTPSLFYKRKVLPEENLSIRTAPVFTPNNIYFQRETFTLGIADVRNRYIDLNDEPVSESVSIQVLNGVNYLKGKHYDLLAGKKGINRLTWDPRRLTSGVGMMDIMVENAQFEVTYARKNPV